MAKNLDLKANTIQQRDKLQEKSIFLLDQLIKVNRQKELSKSRISVTTTTIRVLHQIDNNQVDHRLVDNNQLDHKLAIQKRGRLLGIMSMNYIRKLNKILMKLNKEKQKLTLHSLTIIRNRIIKIQDEKDMEKIIKIQASAKGMLVRTHLKQAKEE